MTSILENVCQINHDSFFLRITFVAVTVILQKQIWREISSPIRKRVNFESSEDEVEIEKKH